MNTNTRFTTLLAATAVFLVLCTIGRAAGDDAVFAQASVAKVIAPAGRMTATVSFKNTGTTTWSKAGGYRLGSQNPHDNAIWGTNRVDLTVDVPPQGVATFTFEITAPKDAATYNFQWRMVHEGVTWFGPVTPNVTIDVKP
jgi:hypothetical protein